MGNRKNMKVKTQNTRDELRPEYDFDYYKAVRGKYHKRLAVEGANIVVLESDVAKVISNSATVNEALRSRKRSRPLNPPKGDL